MVAAGGKLHVFQAIKLISEKNLGQANFLIPGLINSQKEQGLKESIVKTKKRHDLDVCALPKPLPSIGLTDGFCQGLSCRKIPKAYFEPDPYFLAAESRRRKAPVIWVSNSNLRQ